MFELPPPRKWWTSNDPLRFVLFPSLPDNNLVAQPVNYWPWIDQLPRLRHQWCYSWKRQKIPGVFSSCWLNPMLFFPKIGSFSDVFGLNIKIKLVVEFGLVVESTSGNGKWVVWGPVVWDSRDTPKNPNPFHEGIPWFPRKLRATPRYRTPNRQSPVPQLWKDSRLTACWQWFRGVFQRCAETTLGSWWLNQPIRNHMQTSNWIISQGIGVKIQNIWNHHLVFILNFMWHPPWN